MEIWRLEFLPGNVAKLREHAIEVSEVQSVVNEDVWVIDRHQAYPHQARMIGPTARGRFITVVLEGTEAYGVWRPVTGWESTSAERAYYWEQRA